MLPNITPKRQIGEQIQYDLHLKRLDNMLPTIDSHQKEIKNLFSNKKWEIENNRKKKMIEFENRLILDRIALASQKSKLDNNISNNVNYVRDFKKKLYENSRKIRLEKITKENEELLYRIVNSK
jgi:hypothetical protein